MNQILVTGANGQLGSEIQDLAEKYTDFSFVFTDVHNLDLTDDKVVRDFISKSHFYAIVNCAAFTAVDKAETDVELCDAINHKAAETLALLAKELDIKLIHVSTDYVFDGAKETPYKEDDVPCPHGIYGETKLKGEQAMQQVNPKNSIIIRTSWLYSSYGNNFVKTMLRLAEEGDELNVVSDQIGSPTYAHDLAKVILDILPKIKNDKVEIYHYANSGKCSWHEFAKTIFKIKDIDIKINSIITDQYPTAAKRPKYSVMDTSKIRNHFSLEIPDWEQSLHACLKNIDIKQIN